MSLKSVGPALVAVVAACAAKPPSGISPQPESSPALEAGFEAVRPDTIFRHVEALASDAFEGRAPGTAGEAKTLEYLEAQFRRLGLKPGNPDGTYRQTVPLVGMRAASEGAFDVRGKKLALRVPDDAVFLSRRPQSETLVRDSEVVFVGYGIVASEYAWDDFKGADLRGKTLLFLINDPPISDPKDPTRLDPALFKGEAMTYRGRYTYKYEVASMLGAAAALIIHETGPAGYPYDVVQSGWAKENFDLGGADVGRGRVPIEGWISEARALALLAATGHDLEALRRAAMRRDFSPVPLGARATLRARMTRNPIASANVLARLEGRDPTFKDEVVLYTAHWDHLGKKSDGAAGEDAIYNGALDNASGVAEMLAIAEAFTRVRPPRRSVVFLSPTGEEAGLLGARHYASRPLYPLEKTLANINMDVMNFWGRTREIVSIGHGATTLDEILEHAAARQGRVVRPDPEPEKGYYYRSDHFELVKRGVPALHFLHPGADYRDRPPEYGPERRRSYATRDYHKVSDDVKADWDLSGAVEDVHLLFETGYRVADGDRFPEWKPGTEFKAVRDASLAAFRGVAPGRAPGRAGPRASLEAVPPAP